MFSEKSRYHNTKTYAHQDRKGRSVLVVAVPEPRLQFLQGFHARRQGQRLDHLAAHYLSDPTAFWRICDANDAMLPEALSEQAETAIPLK